MNPLISISFRGLLMSIMLMSLAACNSLAVFMPNLPSAMSQDSGAQLNQQGFLQLNWGAGDSSADSKARFDVYGMEVTDDDDIYQFGDNATSEALLTQESISVSSSSNLPMNKGALLATVKDLSFVYSDLLVPGKKYALQVIQKARRPQAGAQSILLVQVNFPQVSAGAANLQDGGFLISWNEVPGANRYIVYADEGMSTTLGETTATSLLIASKDVISGASFYVRALRGELASPEVTRIDVQSSDARILRVEAISANGLYKADDQLDFVVSFSKPVAVYGAASLPLMIGATSKQASYISGSSSTSLRFRYKVKAGDNTDRLASGQVLIGKFIDPFGIEVSGAMPAEGKGDTLKEASQIVIDTKAPGAPSQVAFNQLQVSTGTLDVQWTSGSDLHFDHDEIKLCMQSNCSNGCLVTSLPSSNSMSFTGLGDGSYYACVRSFDSLGHASEWAASQVPASVDTTPPVIVRAYALSSDGAYKEGQSLSLAVEFSEPVTVSGGGDISLMLETGAVDHSAGYQGGSGTKVLTFTYTVQSGDSSSDLNYRSSTALGLGAGGNIRDSVGLAAVLNLPAVNAAEALAGQSQISLDTLAPTDPSTVAFTTSSPAPSTSVSVGWTASSDVNFKQHNVKLCGANDCASSCLSTSVTTGNAATLVGVNGAAYYACVQGEDSLGHLSDWKASAASLTINSTIPHVVQIKAVNPDGVYKEGQGLDFSVTFDDVVMVAGNPKITLATGSTNRDMIYSAGDGSQVLTFTYTVQLGDTSARLNYLSSNALYLNSGTLNSVSGNNASLVLPDPSSSNSLGSQSQIVIDTSVPSAPSAVVFSTSSPSSSTSLAFSWTASSDTNFKQHNIKLCTDTFCSAGCVGASNVTGNSGNASGVDGETYHACVRGEDQPGHLSAWVSSAATVSIDTVAPKVLDVSSTASDGYYVTGQNISISVQFSEPIILASGANPTLRLATGSTEELATFSSISGSDTLVFSYTVQAGDTSADLDYTSTSALVLGSGSIKDAAGNDADLLLPAPGSANSLGGQKALVVDTTLPTAPTSPGFGASTSYTSAVSLSWGVSTDANFLTHSIKLCTVDDCNTGCLSTSTAVGTSATLVGVNGSTYYGCVQGKDAAGLTSAWVASLNPVLINSSQPAILDVSSSLADGLYKAGTSIPISIKFSKVVYVTNSAGLGLMLETGSTDHAAIYASGDGTDTLTFQYTTQAGDTSSDLEYHDVNALALGGGTIKDSGGNDAELQLPPLQSSTSLGGQKAIAIDTTAPAVTSVSSSQANGSYKVGDVISIRVQFSEIVALTSSSSFGLLLETGSNDRTASYASGAGTTTLIFSYTVQSGDTSSDLEYESTSALSIGSGSIRDSSGNDAVLTLPALNSANSLAGQKAIVIDTTAPTAPIISSPANNSYSATAITVVSGTGEANASLALKDGSTSIGTTTIGAGGTWSITLGNALTEGSHSLTATATDAAGNVSAVSASSIAVVDTTAPTAPSSVGFASPITNNTNFAMSWSNSSDSNFSTHNVKICTAADCNTGCTSQQTATTSPSTMTGVNGATYYGCVQGLDLAGNISAWINSTGTMTVDTTASVITNVSSSQANGIFKAAAVIPIQVKFNEIVYVMNGAGLSLLLETGTTDHSAIYSSGSGSDTLTFTYTVQVGDTSSDLEYQSTSALALGGGTIKDAAGNNADLTLPSLNSASSLAGQKALVIDTTAPSSPVFTSPVNSSTVTTPIYSVSGTTEANAAIEVFEGGNSLGTTTANAGGNWSLTLASPYMNGTFTFSATATDAAGNTSAPGTTQVTVAIPVPTVYAGSDIYSSSSSASLVGTATNAVSYQWSKVSGPGTVSFGSGTSLNTTVSLSATGVYVLRLTATNVAGVSANSTLTYTYDTTSPTFTGITDIWQVSPTSVQIYWNAAIDDLSDSKGLTYELCYSSTLGTCDSSNFVAMESMDSNRWDKLITGLSSGTVYEFMVRAVDLAGNTSFGNGLKYSGGLQDVKKIVGKSYARCALLNSGIVKCWGDNTYTQLGQGGSSTTNKNSPVTVVGLSGAKDISSGDGHFCVILNDNTVQCWGRNGNGQVGNGQSGNSKSSPQTVSGISNVSALSLGSLHSCALISDGSVKCWGRNDVGQLGDGSTTDSTTPTTVSGVSNAVGVKSGNHFNCATFSNKSLKCWGQNNYGQLGNGNTTTQTSAVSVSLANIESYALGEAFTCAVVSGGAAYCWGYGGYGNLGRGSSSNSSSPVSVPSITSGASSVEAGYGFACAQMSDGSVKCWGENNFGQFANDSITNTNTPVTVTSLNNVSKMSLSWDGGCGLFSGNIWRCWGRDESGDLGDGRLNIRVSPAELKSLASNAKDIVSGFDHTCVLMNDETVSCWGTTEYGQIGGWVSGTSKVNYATPRAVSGLTGVKKIVAAGYHTCALLSDTTVKCWGRGNNGQLGNNGTSHQSTPQTVVSTSGSGSLSGVVDLALGQITTCAILSDGSMQCWGYSNTGMLGDGRTNVQSNYPVVASAFSGMTIKQAILGYNHLCAILDDTNKTVKCLGKNDRNQVADGTTTDRTTPVTTMTGVTKLSTFRDTTCAVKTDKSVWCWGSYNDSGQIGVGDFSTHSTPQKLTGISDPLAIGMGTDFSCAVLSDHTVKCWGDNDYGRLGSPTVSLTNINDNRSTPIDMPGMSSAGDKIALGYAHGCLITTDSRVVCWGYNNKNQLGVDYADNWALTPKNAIVNFSFGD